MNSFHPGDPVLIINGRDAQHLAHVGKGTVVMSEHITGRECHAGALTEGYLVDLSLVVPIPFGMATDLLYRHKDLMPINPINDEPEVTQDEQDTEKEFARIEETRRHI